MYLSFKIKNNLSKFKDLYWEPRVIPADQFNITKGQNDDNSISQTETVDGAVPVVSWASINERFITTSPPPTIKNIGLIIEGILLFLII